MTIEKLSDYTHIYLLRVRYLSKQWDMKSKPLSGITKRNGFRIRVCLGDAIVLKKVWQQFVSLNFFYLVLIVFVRSSAYCFE